MQQHGSFADLVHVGPWENMPAVQQPEWRDHPAYDEACRFLSSAPPLVTATETRQLREALANLVSTGALVLQLGDCAESFYECTPRHTSEKLKVIDSLGDRLAELTGRHVVRVGRMGGQFAKPRSAANEWYEAVRIPSFRGHMINSDIGTSETRKAHPRRMVWAYEASDLVQRVMRTYRQGDLDAGPPDGPWSSHEALVVDYESRLIRRDPDSSDLYLSSTHLPWLGERTRQPDGAHVAMLSSVANAVGCKIGPRANTDDVLAVCAALDPRREPGRLVLIARMGRDRIADALPPIVRAVANAGHPAIWLSDPMHGNTRRLPTGLKTRYLGDMTAEAVRFREILDAQGQPASGLHIEVAAQDVTECVGGPVADEDELQRHYTSLCDPRLNPWQAAALIEAWSSGTT
ncbi:3-deoxy-D-arabinoheptulosonate-7-phosphate synthase [Asanoa ferruginea]|uniref:Phospho-2-dehydro-3-deoxyheptonate aldolase n=1 Tax=Asanoa ferruginea TaxID=53367 RepID=A0A3D9ZWJ8_9ACTN|nr:3-deoxy-7-phosphoheptulonate synthase [Asanoa ferruginea]REG00975.1 3-deoxy-D-arabinoheptulosonate-7-phosphate synthase [Asanoa ferruginea]GIF47575.1 phospho-2-dehydro-3-deoxyheptonate aldolase [Asanoa ferruginea]